MSVIEDKIKLIEKILENKISQKGVEKEIHRIELQYGKDAFSGVSFNKKERPWSREYYEELERLSLGGADSKEYILHLVEVRDELVNKGFGGIAIFFNSHKVAVIICAVALIVVIALICK